MNYKICDSDAPLQCLNAEQGQCGVLVSLKGIFLAFLSFLLVLVILSFMISLHLMCLGFVWSM